MEQERFTMSSWSSNDLVLLITLCLIAGAGYFIKCWYKKLSYLIECIDKVPGVHNRSIWFYLSMLRYVYTPRKNVNTRTLILQLANGLCHVLDKQKIASLWITLRPVVIFFKPETVEVLLSSHTTIDKSYEYSFLHPWLGTGLLTSKGEKWRTRRKLLTPSFHFRILEEFMPIFDEQSAILAEKLTKCATQPFVDIVPLVTMCTLDIISETAMGVKIQAQNGGCADYVQSIHEIHESFLDRLARPWLWLNVLFYCFPSGWKFLKNLKHVHGFTRKVIKERKELLLSKMKQDVPTEESCESTKRKAFLEMLLEHHLQDESFTEEDIREEVDTFMFEGHDTTAMGLSFMLHNLGLLPEIQEKVIQEIDSIFGEDTSRPVTSEDLRQMKYTECVIKESLRLCPSVPFIARELTEDIKVLNYTIPPGTLCVMSVVMLHRNEEVFPNPEKFDPERFFPENAAGRHPYAYIPFSAGPRNCIGQKFAMLEEKTLLANIFRKVRVKSLDPRDKLNITCDIIFRNADPLRLKIIPRINEKRSAP